jgi:hypothetical protein
MDCAISWIILASWRLLTHNVLGHTTVYLKCYNKIIQILISWNTWNISSFICHFMFSLRLYIARSGTLTCNNSKSLNPNLKLTLFQRCGHEQEHLVKMSRLSCDKLSIGEGVWYGPRRRGCGCLVELIGEKQKKLEARWNCDNISMLWSVWMGWFVLWSAQEVIALFTYMIVNIVEFNYLIFFSIPQ